MRVSLRGFNEFLLRSFSCLQLLKHSVIASLASGLGVRGKL